MSDYDCKDDCFNHTLHRFYCDIDLAPYKGLNVVKTWELEGQDLSRLNKGDNRFTFLSYNDHEVSWHAMFRLNPFESKLFSDAYFLCINKHF